MANDTKTVNGVEITDSYDNTERLLKAFPVENPTPITSELGKKILNRLLTGFENWNRGIPAWKAWGTILYTQDSIYDVHGARMTLAEYQTSMATLLKRVDIKMGAFHNVLVNDNWTAIRYDISTNGQPGTVMEFVNFKDYGPELGVRVVEGWGGPKDQSYPFMCMFLNDEEKAAEAKAAEKVIAWQIPETDNLEEKYKVLNPTTPDSANAAAMKMAILKDFDAWNQGEAAWEANVDSYLSADAVIGLPGLKTVTLEEYKKDAADFRKKTGREKKYFDSILISGDWAAYHFRYVDTDVASGKKDAGDGMHFVHFAADGKVDQLYIAEPVGMEQPLTGKQPSAKPEPAKRERKLLSAEEKRALTARIAESYHSAYDAKAVKDGATYDSWVFAKDAEYWSPYFGNTMINLTENPMSVEDSATFEALAYSVSFSDWGPLDFESYPTDFGVAWKTHFGGHRRDNGEMMDFFAYSYLRINDYGEITHWETHVNSDYNDFLDVAIGEHGPYRQGASAYMAAVMKKLASAGIDLSKFRH